MKSKRTHKQTALLFVTVLLLLALLFIWGNSLLPAAISSKISSFVAQLLGKGAEEVPVRKTGHFTEFFVFGGILGLYVTLRGSQGKEKLTHLVFPGMFVPLMDETIQMFNDRGPQVQDIWIDIAGYTCGCLLMLLAIALVRRFFRSRKEKKEG